MLHVAAIALAAALTVPAWEPEWRGNYVVEGSCPTRESSAYRGTLRIRRGADDHIYALTWQIGEDRFVGSALSVQGQLVVEFRRADGRKGLMGAHFGPGAIYAQWVVHGAAMRCSETWRVAT